ncbi:hypothetical protein ABPG73_022322 [Tetrahymena malaccensis]
MNPVENQKLVENQLLHDSDQILPFQNFSVSPSVKDKAQSPLTQSNNHEVLPTLVPLKCSNKISKMKDFIKNDYDEISEVKDIEMQNLEQDDKAASGSSEDLIKSGERKQNMVEKKQESNIKRVNRKTLLSRSKSRITFLIMLELLILGLFLSYYYEFGFYRGKHLIKDNEMLSFKIKNCYIKIYDYSPELFKDSDLNFYSTNSIPSFINESILMTYTFPNQKAYGISSQMSYASLDVSTGDISIQSTKSIFANLSMVSKLYCASTYSNIPITSTIIDVPNCAPVFAYKNSISNKQNLVAQRCLQGSLTVRSSGNEPKQILNAKNTFGNIYINILEKSGASAMQNSQIFYDKQIYGQDGNNINLSTDSLKTLYSQLNETQNSNVYDPIFLFRLGSQNTFSNSFTQWQMTFNPAYTYLKPWWIGTLTVSLLNAKQYINKITLAPGFCPYVPALSQSRIYQTQQLLSNIMQQGQNGAQKIITFGWQDSINLPPIQFTENTVYDGNKQIDFTNTYNDDWLVFSILTDGTLSVDSTNLNSNQTLLAAVVVSFILAVILGLVFMIAITYVINKNYLKTLDHINHVDTYYQIKKQQGKIQGREIEMEKFDIQDSQQLKKDKKVNKIQLFQNKQQNFFETLKQKIDTKNSDEIRKMSADIIKQQYTISGIFNLFYTLVYLSPPLSAYIDQVILLFYKASVNSSASFFNLLFVKEKQSQESQDQIHNLEKDSISLQDVKSLYEQYCYLNQYLERKLEDKQNANILKQLGFKISVKQDTLVSYYTYIICNGNHSNSAIIQDDETKNSLDNFIKNRCQLTKFDSDSIDSLTFEKYYNEFCNKNHLEKVQLNESQLKREYGIETRFLPKQIIERDEDYDLNKKTKYNIDQNRVQKNFELVLSQDIEKVITQKENNDELVELIKDIYMPKGWIILDFLIVLAHLIIIIVIGSPIILSEEGYKKLIFFIKDLSEGQFKEIIKKMDIAQRIEDILPTNQIKHLISEAENNNLLDPKLGQIIKDNIEIIVRDPNAVAHLGQEVYEIAQNAQTYSQNLMQKLENKVKDELFKQVNNLKLNTLKLFIYLQYQVNQYLPKMSKSSIIPLIFDIAQYENWEVLDDIKEKFIFNLIASIDEQDLNNSLNYFKFNQINLSVQVQLENQMDKSNIKETDKKIQQNNNNAKNYQFINIDSQSFALLLLFQRGKLATPFMKNSRIYSLLSKIFPGLLVQNRISEQKCQIYRQKLSQLKFKSKLQFQEGELSQNQNNLSDNIQKLLMHQIEDNLDQNTLISILSIFKIYDNAKRLQKYQKEISVFSKLLSIKSIPFNFPENQSSQFKQQIQSLSDILNINEYLTQNLLILFTSSNSSKIVRALNKFGIDLNGSEISFIDSQAQFIQKIELKDQFIQEIQKDILKFRIPLHFLQQLILFNSLPSDSETLYFILNSFYESISDKTKLIIDFIYDIQTGEKNQKCLQSYIRDINISKLKKSNLQGINTLIKIFSNGSQKEDNLSLFLQFLYDNQKKNSLLLGSMFTYLNGDGQNIQIEKKEKIENQKQESTQKIAIEQYLSEQLDIKSEFFSALPSLFINDTQKFSQEIIKFCRQQDYQIQRKEKLLIQNQKINQVAPLNSTFNNKKQILGETFINRITIQDKELEQFIKLFSSSPISSSFFSRELSLPLDIVELLQVVSLIKNQEEENRKKRQYEMLQQNKSCLDIFQKVGVDVDELITLIKLLYQDFEVIDYHKLQNKLKLPTDFPIAILQNILDLQNNIQELEDIQTRRFRINKLIKQNYFTKNISSSDQKWFQLLHIIQNDYILLQTFEQEIEMLKWQKDPKDIKIIQGLIGSLQCKKVPTQPRILFNQIYHKLKAKNRLFGQNEQLMIQTNQQGKDKIEQTNQQIDLLKKGSTYQYGIYLLCQEMHISPIWMLLMSGDYNTWCELCETYYQYYKYEIQSKAEFNPVQALIIILNIKQCPTIIKEYLIQNELAIVSSQLFPDQYADFQNKTKYLFDEQNSILKNILFKEIKNFYQVAQKVQFPQKILNLVASYEFKDYSKDKRVKFSESEVEKILIFTSQKKLDSLGFYNFTIEMCQQFQYQKMTSILDLDSNKINSENQNGQIKLDQQKKQEKQEKELQEKHPYEEIENDGEIIEEIDNEDEEQEERNFSNDKNQGNEKLFREQEKELNNIQCLKFTKLIDFYQGNYEPILQDKNLTDKYQKQIIGILNINGAQKFNNKQTNLVQLTDNLSLVSEYLKSNQRTLIQLILLFIDGYDFNLTSIGNIYEFKSQNFKAFACCCLNKDRYNLEDDIDQLLSYTSYTVLNKEVIKKTIKLYLGEIAQMMSLVSNSKNFSFDTYLSYKQLYKLLYAFDKTQYHKNSMLQGKLNIIEFLNTSTEENEEKQNEIIFQICNSVIYSQGQQLDPEVFIRKEDSEKNQFQNQKFKRFYHEQISIIRFICNNDWGFITKIHTDEYKLQAFCDLFDLDDTNFNLIQALSIIKPDILQIKGTNQLDEFFSGNKTMEFIEKFKEFDLCKTQEEKQQLLILACIKNKSFPHLVSFLNKFVNDEQFFAEDSHKSQSNNSNSAIYGQNPSVLGQSSDIIQTSSQEKQIQEGIHFRQELSQILLSILMVKTSRKVNWIELYTNFDKQDLSVTNQFINYVNSGFNTFSSIFDKYFDFQDTALFQSDSSQSGVAFKHLLLNDSNFDDFKLFDLDVFIKFYKNDKNTDHAPMISFNYFLKLQEKQNLLKSQKQNFKLSQLITGQYYFYDSKLKQNAIFKSLIMISLILQKEFSNLIFEDTQGGNEVIEKINKVAFFLAKIISNLQIQSKDKKSDSLKLIIEMIDMLFQIQQETDPDQYKKYQIIINLVKKTQPLFSSKKSLKKNLKQLHLFMLKQLNENFQQVTDYLYSDNKIQKVYDSLQNIIDKPILNFQDQDFIQNLQDLLEIIDQEHINIDLIKNVIQIIVKNYFTSLLEIIEYCNLVSSSEFKIIQEAINKDGKIQFLFIDFWDFNGIDLIFHYI